MTKQTEAMKLALEGAANYIDALGGDSRKYRQALAEQPAPMIRGDIRDGLVDDEPAQRTWVGLTDEERIMCRSYDPEEAVVKTEAKLKEKNT